MITKRILNQIILDSIAEINLGSDREIRLAGEDPPLYGAEGQLDSISLVTLITSIEQRLEDNFGIQVVLVDEKAVSQRNSPFRSLSALVDFAMGSIVRAVA